MPFKSKAQQAYMFAHADKLRAQGVNLREWADSTDFKSLPKKAESQFDRGMKEETEEHHLPPPITAKLVLDHLLRKKYYKAGS